MRTSTVILALVALSSALPASAQPRSETSRPQDVQAAAAAFGEGQRAQLRGDYAQAADLFELADRSAPNPVALRSAIRSRREAGHRARAATLALSALARHPEDAETRALADEVIAEASTTLARVRVACEPACSLALDGRAVQASAQQTFDVFVDPGARRLVASWPEREAVVRELDIAAGTDTRLELRPPEVAEPTVEDETAEIEIAEDTITEDELAQEPPMDEAIAMPAPPPPSSGGISPAVFATGAGLTALALGLGIGFGVDTLSARDAYVADPTQARYEDGISRQWVTNGLLFGAAALGIATVVIAIFTDWDGEPASESPRATLPWIMADEHGAALGVAHTFGGET